MIARCLPMLAVRGQPFDSEEYLFEIKWNGIRALASRLPKSQPTSAWDLWGRDVADYRSRYPEMQVLAALPPGTILDGELVLMSQGLPDLEAILARHQLSNPIKIQHASRQQPVTYVVFDLLAHQGRSLIGQPLQARRALLRDLLARWQKPRVQFSEGIVGSGRSFFEQAVRQGQEGIMAKHHSPGFLAIVNDAKSRIRQIDIEEFRRLRESGEPFLLVDVREESEWAAGHASGALHLGKGIIERDIETSVPGHDTKMVLYCGGGFRSALAADNLQKMGYTEVISLDGGWRAYQESGLPVE